MANPVVHFEIMGPDAPALQGFYRDLFGWEIQNVPEMNYGLVNPPGEGPGIGGGIGSSQDGPSFVTVYVQVDDPQAYLDRVEQAGGATVMPVTEIPDMVTFALFRDPQGNIVGLVKAA